MNEIELKLCDIQGRLFELSSDYKYTSIDFINSFMKSKTVKKLDSNYNRLQWAGEEYLLEEVSEEIGSKLSTDGEIFSKDILYWIGFIYRYWHYYTGESSLKILKQASVKTMRTNYLMFHTMDPTLSIDKFKEIYNQKKK